MIKYSLILLLFSLNYVYAQSVYLAWYDHHGTTYCGEYTPKGDFIRDLGKEDCRAVSPTSFKWYNHHGTIYCGEYTDKGLLVTDGEKDDCRKSQPTFLDWYNHYGTVYCGEFTQNKQFVMDVDNDQCRHTVNGGQKSSSGTNKAIMTIEQINQNLQPQDGSQIILTTDLAVPRNQGCGAPQDATGNVQCWVCQGQSSRNSMLYTKEGILGIGSIRMLDTRKEVYITLVDSDDLGSIRCMNKNKNEIQINYLEDLGKALEASGLKFKDPGFIVRTLKNTQPTKNQTPVQSNER